MPAFIVSTGGGWSGSLGLQDLPEVALVLWSCVPSFRPLSCFALGALPTNMALFRVLRGFSAGFGVLVCVCIAFLFFVFFLVFVCVRG